ncbi:FUSC family protein [Marinobacter sp. GN3S48]|uniref:FUSC family protein n=1 Tax=Marinobacter sp. GN3S48 TaxID=3382302 RepID=UPI00387B11DA
MTNLVFRPFEAVGCWLGTDRPALFSALLLALSAWIAFSIASMLHLQNAFWAAMPVWVVAQSSRGLLLARAFYRIVGTLTGAAAGLALLQSQLDGYVIAILLASLAALSAGLTHVLRGPQAYASLMTGITAAVVVIPALASDLPSIGLAIARIECTLIGVASVTLIMGVFTPPSPREPFYRKVRQFEHDCIRFALQQLKGGYENRESESRKLMVAMADINSEATVVTAGSIESHRRQLQIEAIVTNCMMLIAECRALASQSGGWGQGLERLCSQLEGLLPRFSSTEPARPQPWWFEDKLEIPEERALKHTVIRILQADAELVSHQAPKRRPFSPLAPYADGWLALRTAVLSGLAVLVAALATSTIKLTGVEIGALGICIFSLVLGSMPEPQKIAPKLLSGVIAGVIFAIGYRLVIQPEINSLHLLLLSIAPFFLLGGIARTSERFSVPALDANMCFLLASQAGMPEANVAAVLQQSLALTIGAGLVASGYLLVPVDPRYFAELSVRSLRKHLSTLAWSETGSHDQLKAKIRQRIVRCFLYANRESLSAYGAPTGLLSALNLADAIVQLKALGTDRTARRSLRALRFLSKDPEQVLRIIDKLALRSALPEVAATLDKAALGLKEIQRLDGVWNP